MCKLTYDLDASDSEMGKTLPIRSVLWVLFLGILALFELGIGLVVGPETALAFTIYGTNNTPDDPSDDLLDAARWSNVPGSLVEQGVRGLGGGIEYASDGNFCTNIIPQFIDQPKPTCEQLKEVIKRAFNKWSAGHPILRFTDVTGKIKPEQPPPEYPNPWIGFGAEIDLFAFPFRLAGWTNIWWLYDDPIGTSGKILPGNTLTSADVIFNTHACFHLNPALAGRGCGHFESVAIHEIGHALGLDHLNGNRNFDTDNNPFNRMAIDCEDPTGGLRPSPNTDPMATMSTSSQKPPVYTEPRNDDLGGRDFLYPICTSILFQDNFSDPHSGWSVGSGGEYEYSYEDDEYSITVNKLNSLAWAWAPLASRPVDFIVEVEAKPISEPNGEYGIIWGRDNDNHYVFRVDTDGRYILNRRVNGDWEPNLVPWTNHSAINRGTGKNRLKVIVKGDEITLIANDIVLHTVAVSSFGTVSIGLIAGTDTSPNDYAHVHFDNFKILQPRVSAAANGSWRKLEEQSLSVQKVEPAEEG